MISFVEFRKPLSATFLPTIRLRSQLVRCDYRQHMVDASDTLSLSLFSVRIRFYAVLEVVVRLIVACFPNCIPVCTYCRSILLRLFALKIVTRLWCYQFWRFMVAKKKFCVYVLLTVCTVFYIISKVFLKNFQQHLTIRVARAFQHVVWTNQMPGCTKVVR